MSLELDRVNIYYSLGRAELRAVSDVTLNVNRGESLGIIGETGSGKTTLVSSIVRTLPENARFEGRISLDGADIHSMPLKEFRKNISWSKISIIPQYSMNALNPVKKIGEQLGLIASEHTNWSTQEIAERIYNLFKELGLPPETYFKLPDELSGGQKQRVIIASALLLEPDVVIADEPTTALDVINQAKVISLIKRSVKERGKTMLYITHDIAVVAGITDKMVTMYAGKVMEYGSTRKMFREPLHPYTMLLINSVPDIRRGRVKKLSYIPGEPPDLIKREKGCSFAKRCPIARDICRLQEPELKNIDGRLVSCHFAEETVTLRQG
ncbi:dipeptide/oligopeptide/nickel ABC transporter ATP-binding protein [Sulfolobales archaeon HS-7]|nr:dipeptide/oligopeptide/nickel ABC transporter ATP-binding protein [Sulfolobales archaeon HS-7]